MDPDVLTDLTVANLRADGFTVQEPPPPPKPSGKPDHPTGTQTQHIPEWVERLADVLALIVSAFAIMQAGSWAGKDNFIVALAIGAAIAFLVVNYNGPLRQWLRAIFVELILTLVTLVEAIGRFFEAANKYYGGNFARMVLSLVLVPVALGVLSELLQYPAIRSMVDWLQQVIQNVRDLAQHAVEWTDAQVAKVERWATQQVHDVLALIPHQLDAFGERITGQFQNLFTQAHRRIDTLNSRVEQQGRTITAWVDHELLASKASLVLFGQRLDLMPELTRQYLASRLNRQLEPTAADLPPAPADGPPIPEALRTAAAEVVRQLEAATRGEDTALHRLADRVTADVREASGGPAV